MAVANRSAEINFRTPQLFQHLFNTFLKDAVLIQNHFSCTTLSPWSKNETEKGTRRHDPWPYLEKDPKGDELPITFLEEHREDALLPHLVHDDDAQGGGGEEHQKQQHVREPLPGTADHSVAFWSVLASIHRLLLPHQVHNAPALLQDLAWCSNVEELNEAAGTAYFAWVFEG